MLIWGLVWQVVCVWNRPFTLWKVKFNIDGVIGQAFGSSIVLQNGELVKVNLAEIDCDVIDKGNLSTYLG